VSVTYEVTATMDAGLMADWLAWLRDEHAARVLATGCFAQAILERESDTQARIRYIAPDRASVERYLSEHAARLRDEGLTRFPAGIAYRRAVWEAAGEVRGGGGERSP
jgi:hypothetical protein